MEFVSKVTLMKNRVYIEVPKEWRDQARELHGEPLIVNLKRVLGESNAQTRTQTTNTNQPPPDKASTNAEREKTVKSTARAVYDHLSRYEGKRGRRRS